MKVSTWVYTAAVVLWAGSSATSGDAPPPRSGNPDRGLAIFNAYCIGCHGSEGKGDGPMAAKLKRDFQVVPTDLTDKAWQLSRDDASLKRVIRGGGGKNHRSIFMPAWGMTLTSRQVDDLTVFIRELKEPVPGEPPKVSILNIQEPLELGRTVFSLYCASCHGRNGQGDGPLVEAADNVGALSHVPPNFTTPGFFLDRTDRQLRKMAESGAAHAGMQFDFAQSAWWHRSLSEKELDGLTFFLRAQGLVYAPLSAPPRTAQAR